CEAIMVSMEREETLFAVVNEVMCLVKYGLPTGVTPDGHKLTVSMRKGSIQLYPSESSLLLRNKGASNPIAEHCLPQKTIFQLTGEGKGNHDVDATLSFSFHAQDCDTVFLHVHSLCEDEQ
ncbi:MAG: hypothetical protein WCP87_06795, partial [Atribacterota bacterium]